MPPLIYGFSRLIRALGGQESALGPQFDSGALIVPVIDIVDGFVSEFVGRINLTVAGAGPQTSDMTISQDGLYTVWGFLSWTVIGANPRQFSIDIFDEAPALMGTLGAIDVDGVGSIALPPIRVWLRGNWRIRVQALVGNVGDLGRINVNAVRHFTG